MAASVTALHPPRTGPSALRRARIVAPVSAIARLQVSRDVVVTSWLVFVLNLGMAWVVVFRLNIFVTDAMSRALHAWQVFFANDPKLTSIGFIWAPLPTLLQLPLVLFPPLRFNGLSGNLVTAFMGAFTAAGVLVTLESLGVSRRTRLMLVALFALNPMMLFYAGNGMSEMTSTAFTVWSIAFLVRWANSGWHFFWLIMSSFSLGLACLSRYDSLIQAALMVLVVPYLRGEERLRPSERQALTLAYIAPIGAAFGLWILMNWLIMGDPIYFARGDYSNAAQIGYQMALLPEIARMAGNPVAIAGFLGRQISLLFPLFTLSLAVLALYALRAPRERRLAVTLVVLALTFPAFQALNFFAAQSAAFLRYFILAIPFGVMLVGALLALAPRGLRHVATALTLLLVIASNISTGVTMYTSTEWGQWNDIVIRDVLNGTSENTWAVERQIADYLTANHVGRDILVDDFQGYRIVFFTGRPEWFVATGDQDFDATLRDPVGRVRYMLVSSTKLEGALNKVNIVYPTLYERGAPWARLEQDWSSGDPMGSTWRLYRILDTPPGQEEPAP